MYSLKVKITKEVLKNVPSAQKFAFYVFSDLQEASQSADKK